MVCIRRFFCYPKADVVQLGPIYELELPSGCLIVISDYELFDEICNEKRFTKIPGGPLTELRPALHDGLFSARPGEHAWQVAHRTLMPSFGPLAIRDMFDGECYTDRMARKALS